MTKTRTLLAAAFVLALGGAPAFAGEGQGNPFGASAFGWTTAVGPRPAADSNGAERPYDPSGRPGTGLRLSAELLPINGQNSVVQTANSAPPGFVDGTVQSAQASSVQAWHAAQLRRATAAAATAVAAQADGAGPRG